MKGLMGLKMAGDYLVQCLSDCLDIYSLFSLQYVNRATRDEFYLSRIVQSRILIWILRQNNSTACHKLEILSPPKLLLERLHPFSFAQPTGNVIKRFFVLRQQKTESSRSRQICNLCVVKCQFPCALDPESIQGDSNTIYDANLTLFPFTTITIVEKNSDIQGVASRLTCIAYFEISFVQSTEDTSRRSNSKSDNSRCSVGLITNVDEIASNRDGFTPYSFVFHPVGQITQSGSIVFENPAFSYVSTDVVGCGIVYPPLSTHGSGYIFFSKNGSLVHMQAFPAPEFLKCCWYPMATCSSKCEVLFNFGRDSEFLFDVMKFEEELYHCNPEKKRPMIISDYKNKLAVELLQSRMSNFCRKKYYDSNPFDSTIILNESIVSHIYPISNMFHSQVHSDSELSSISDLHSGSSSSLGSNLKLRASAGIYADESYLPGNGTILRSPATLRFSDEEDMSMVVEVSSIDSGALQHITKLEIYDEKCDKVVKSNIDPLRVDAARSERSSSNESDDQSVASLRVEIASVDEEGSYKHYGTQALEESFGKGHVFDDELTDYTDTGLLFHADEAIDVCDSLCYYQGEYLGTSSGRIEQQSNLNRGNKNSKRKRGDSCTSLASQLSSNNNMTENRKARRLISHSVCDKRSTSFSLMNTVDIGYDGGSELLEIDER